MKNHQNFSEVQQGRVSTLNAFSLKFLSRFCSVGIGPMICRIALCGKKSLRNGSGSEHTKSYPS